MAATDRARANLARGPQVRSERAALKRRITEGSLNAADVLEGAGGLVEDVASAMPVRQLLEAIPGVGTTTAATIMGELELPTDVRLYGLAPSGRRQLADRVREETAA